MAGIIYSAPAASKNPTANYIPLNLGLPNFVDSDIINLIGGNLWFAPNGVLQGLNCDFAQKRAQLGDFGAGDINLTVDSLNQFVNFTGPVGVIISNTSSGSSGQHLCISVNGTAYKIRLENP